MAIGDVFVVCGARRTGTTLLAAVLSADPTTPPLPGEAQLLSEWLATFRWACEAFAVRALPFFDDEAELRRFYEGLLEQFITHCRHRFGSEATLVLKSPELSLVFEAAYSMLPAARFLVTIRDPRDQVASEWRVVERRRAHAEDLRVISERDVDTLARAYVSYYEPILRVLEQTPERIFVQSYEHLVEQPADAIASIERFTGLRLDGFDPLADWPRVADTYWAYGTSPSDTPHYGRAIEAGRVGTWRESLSAEEASRVAAVCAGVTSRMSRWCVPRQPPERHAPGALHHRPRGHRSS
jgi:hypothetical protein